MTLVDTETGEVIEQDTGGAIVLDEELINHLAVPAFADALYRERFASDYLMQDETLARQVLEYQTNYIHEYSKPADLPTLQYRFKTVDFEAPRCDTAWLITQFKIRYVRNQAQDVIEDIAQGVGRADPREAISVAAREFARLREESRPRNTVLTNHDYEHVLDAHFMRLEDLDGPMGVPFGYPIMDTALLGLKKGMLCFVIGRPKRYKTWQLLKSMVEAQKQGYKTVFYTLEMSLEEMYQRYACMVTGIGWVDFQRGTLTTKEKKFLYEKMESVRDGYESVKILRPPVGDRRVRDLAAIAKEHDAQCVYVDQMKFIECDLKVAADKRFALIERVCEELKEAAEDVPFYVACQFNREAANLTEMADLSKIGLSDAIGQTGDILLGLHMTKTMRESGEIQFGVIDARQFEPQVWTLAVELSAHSNFRATGTV